MNRIIAKLVMTGLVLAGGPVAAQDSAEIRRTILEVPEFGAPEPGDPGARIPMDKSDMPAGARASQILFGIYGEPDGGLHMVNGRLVSIRLVGARSKSGELADRIAIADVSDATGDPDAAVGCAFPPDGGERSFRFREGGHAWRLRIDGDQVSFLGPFHEQQSEFQAVHTSLTQLKLQRAARAEGGKAPQYTGRVCVQTLGDDGELADLECGAESWWKREGNEGSMGERRPPVKRNLPTIDSEALARSVLKTFE